MKILSPDIIHKSDVGGVRLDLTSADAVRKAAADIFERAGRLKPGARIAGVTVQAMVRRPKARELIAGLADDPTFGPVVVFGRGGTAVEVINDKSLALPPLDLKLAESDRANAGVAHPQGLSRRAGGGRARDPPRACEAVAACRRPAGDPRARHQPFPRRPERGHRRRCPRDGFCPRRKRGAAPAIRASRCGPIPRSGSATSH